MDTRIETRPTPPGHGDERTTLLAFLDVYRQTMVMKIEGSSEEQARWAPTEQANSLLALILHLTGVERGWFQGTIAGREHGRTGDDEWREATAASRIRLLLTGLGFDSTESVTVAEAVEAYRAECERSNEVMREISSLDDSCKGEPGFSVRWVLMHMLEETARHAGHADITRELIDGAVGF